MKIKYTLLFILTLADIVITSYIGYWREGFWDAVSKVDLASFIYLLGIFGVVALIGCVVTGYSSYLINIISLQIRTVLTRIGLSTQAYRFREGGPQRIQEDCQQYPLLKLNLLTNIGRSIVIIGIFSYLLISKVPLYYLLGPVIYVVLGTLFASFIAKPLINLNYQNQVKEAKFRQDLSLINYEEAYINNKLLYIKLKYLQYFQSFYNQITVIIPLIILAHLYFSGKISFGTLMQLSAIIGEIINSASYIINSFDSINKWLSCKKRLSELGII